MNDERRGYRFTLRELIVVVVILCVGLGMLVPMIQAAREDGRKNSCLNRAKQWGLGVLNYESANKRFPLASDYVGGLVVPGKNDPGLPCGPSPSGGYSWHVRVHPFSISSRFYDSVKSASNNFQVEPFSKQCIDPRQPGVSYFWEDDHDVPDARCPTYAGPSHCVGAHSATRYQNAAPVVTNYMAVVGTHYDPAATPALVQNGILVGSDAIAGRSIKGITMGMVVDGLSNTVLLCESREATYASWYDGSTSWTLGHPDASVPSVVATTPGFSGSASALNYGPDEDHPSRRFFSAGGPYFGLERRWGPSSMHPGGMVIINWADNHGQTVNAKYMDANVWLQIISRDDGTPVEHSAL